MFQIITAGLFLFLITPGLSQAYHEYVTPYGDYCRDFAVYGSCREPIPVHDAMKAIDKYYREKGYRISAFTQRGRFIQVEVFKNDRQVDRVIFDRKTGRLRSVY